MGPSRDAPAKAIWVNVATLLPLTENMESSIGHVLERFDVLPFESRHEDRFAKQVLALNSNERDGVVGVQLLISRTDERKGWGQDLWLQFVERTGIEHTSTKYI